MSCNRLHAYYTLHNFNSQYTFFNFSMVNFNKFQSISLAILLIILMIILYYTYVRCDYYEYIFF